MGMKTVKVDGFDLGYNFNDCVFNAKKQAIEGNVIVEFEFNGKNVFVSPTTDLDLLWRDFETAWIMRWDNIGHECEKEYSEELKQQIKLKQEQNEKKQNERKIEQQKKDKAAKDEFDKFVDGIEVEFKDKELWDKGFANNQDDYGKCIYEYAEGWAKLMQKEISNGNKLQDIASSTSYNLGFLGITGFMYGAAVSILSSCWVHGEELRKWHNK